MVGTGLVYAGLFCLPKNLSQVNTADAGRKTPQENGKKAHSKRPVNCKNCEYLSDDACLLGFEQCSFEAVRVSKRGRTVQKMKCPDDCTYSIDGYCMGICMKNTLENHRKRWKSKTK